LAVLFCFSLLIPSAFAAESTLEQELKNVISFADYPANSNDTGVYLITLMEDGYNGTGYDSSSGIYVYLYNPSKKAFNSSTDLNKMTFAKNFQSDGSPCDFEKYSLTLIESAKDGVLIKAKVKAAASELVIKSSGVRHYAVSEIELFEDGHYNTNAQAYTCGYDFAFTGSGEDLKCERTSFLTIELDVRPTSHIVKDKTEDNNYANLISSVYFSVPKAIEAKYGKLYSIDYEAHKYYTSPIILIKDGGDSDNRLYKNLLFYRGVSSAAAGVDFRFRFGFDTASEFLGDTIKYSYAYGYDGYYVDLQGVYCETLNVMDSYSSVFLVDDFVYNEVLVNSKELESYFLTYSRLKEDYSVQGLFASSLFAHNSDGTIKYDHIIESVTREDFESLPSYASSNSWWQGVQDYGLGYLFNLGTYKEERIIPQIQKVSLNDIPDKTSDYNLFSETYMVSSVDIADLKEYVDSNSITSNTYLFHFAFDDDYYTGAGWLSDNKISDYTYEMRGVVTPVYLNFDIIELGFSDDGVNITTFGIVSSPVNVFPDLEDTSNVPGQGNTVVSREFDWTWLKLLIATFVGLFALYVIISIVNWFKPNKKKTEEKIVIQMPQQTSPPKQYYSNPKRRRSRTSYRRGRRR